VATCTAPGTAANQCGTGIAAGTPLRFELLAESGSKETDNTMAELKSSLSQIGIAIDLKQAPLNSVLDTSKPCTPAQAECSWQLSFFGTQGSWYFPAYPSGDRIFSTGASSNLGSYTDPKADELMTRSTQSDDKAAMQEYGDYLTRNLPVIWLAEPGVPDLGHQDVAAGDRAGPAGRDLAPEVDPQVTRYVGVRVLQALVVIFMVVVIVFFLLHRIPGGPARGILGQQSTQEQIDEFNHEQGFDLPFARPVREVPRPHGDRRLRRLLRREPARRRPGRRPAAEDAGAHRSLDAAGAADRRAARGVPGGAARPGVRSRAVDRQLRPLLDAGLLRGVRADHRVRPAHPAVLRAGPAGQHARRDPVRAGGLVLPVLTAAAGMIAVFSRYLRSSVIDNLHEDYVRTARAKGASEPYLLRNHVLRNSLTAIVSMIGYYIPVAFGGALVVEQMFNYPGMGLLFWNAAQRSDFRCCWAWCS